MKLACVIPEFAGLSLFSVSQDGYEQLSMLPVHTFKGLIRVRFINEQVSLFHFV